LCYTNVTLYSYYIGHILYTEFAMLCYIGHLLYTGFDMLCYIGHICAPTAAQGGHYIMYPTTSDGSMPNNYEFSPCSKNVIAVSTP